MCENLRYETGIFQRATLRPRIQQTDNKLSRLSCSVNIITSDIDTVLAHSSRHTIYLLVHLSRYSLDILSSLFAHL